MNSMILRNELTWPFSGELDDKFFILSLQFLKIEVVTELTELSNEIWVIVINIAAA